MGQSQGKKPTILLCRHAEGQHLTGETFDEVVGPSLTKKGEGEAYRRVARQCIEKIKLTPDIILVSPQLRAIQTALFARKNTRTLLNGKTLKSIPIDILPIAYEQTRCLVNQGNIFPPLSRKWKHMKMIKNDRNFWNAIQWSLPQVQPPKDKNGSGKNRALCILKYIYKRYPGKIVLLICHDGIARDIQSIHSGREVKEIFGLVEIRNIDEQ